MNFATEMSHLTPSGMVVSISRSVLAGELGAKVHDGPAAHVQLWWGSIVPVRPGDRLRYFATPIGIAVEAVGSGGESDA